MRPGALKRALVMVCCGASTVIVCACQSTEDESARIGREGKVAAASEATLQVAAPNRSVKVAHETLLEGGGRKAVAVELTASSSRAQLDVPVLVEVTGAGGKVAYTNATAGVEPLLQRVPSLRPHDAIWWVDDQALTSGASTGLKVRVGTGRLARHGEPTTTLSVQGAHVGEQSGLSTLSGKLLEHGTARSKAAVFGVARRGGRVVAAGRAVIEALPGRPGAAVPFQIFLVGNPAGASTQVSAVAAG